MAIVRRVRKLVNPRARPVKKKTKRKMHSRASNPKHRRRLTPAQIAAGFGGKRARSARKSALKRKRTLSVGGGTSQRRSVRKNPRRASARPRVRTVTKVKYRTRTIVKTVNARAKPKKRRAARRSSNPGLLITYGPAMLNPRKRVRKSVAKHKRKRRMNPKRRAATRTRVVTRYRTRARRTNPHHRRRTRRHNPSILSGGGMSNMGKSVGGILVGVAVTKTVPGMLASSMPSLVSSPLMSVALSAAVAWGAGELAGKFGGSDFGRYVFLGGLAQTGSVLLNAFLPSLGGVIGLSGLTPSNDIMLPYNMFAGRGAMVGAGMPGSAKGMPGRGFTPAFAN